MNHTATTTLQPTTDPTAPNLRQLVRDALDNDPSISQQRIAKEIGTGVSAATLSQWLGGTYQGDNDKVAQRVSSWYDTYQDRRARAGLPDAPEWVETPTTERIESGLRYAQLAQDMAIIYGPAGVSKTKTCQHYGTISPGVFMATMTPATASVLTSLRQVAIACGLRDLPNSSAGLQNAIVAKLAHTRGLLIIDESQHLSIQALDQIRSLHDACLIGVVLAGNEFVYNRMTDGNRAPYLDRLLSRVGKRVALGKPGDADVDALLRGWKISDPGIRTIAHDIARRPGALRMMTKVLRLAASYAAAQDHALSVDDMKAAARDLGGFQ